MEQQTVLRNSIVRWPESNKTWNKINKFADVPNGDDAVEEELMVILVNYFL